MKKGNCVMEHKVTLTIDGKEACVPKGTNVLEAARTVGVEIPSLCYLKDFLGFGACRICLVEIEGFRAPVTACTTIVKDGMKVTTDSPELKEERKFVLDLLFSMHPPECGKCSKLGVCDLRTTASKHKVAKSSFGYTAIGDKVNDPNPFIYRDTAYCILCGKCVRVCQGQGTSVLAFLGRGVNMTVSTPNNLPLRDVGCTFCGSCVEVCPVNALSELPKIGKGRESKYKRFDSVCLECGNTCHTVISVYQGEVVKINAKQKDNMHGYLCAIGRFGFSISKGKRITAPMLREGTGFKEITWDKAIDIITEKLKGGNILVSSQLVNEDVLAVKSLAKALGLKIASTVELYSSYGTIVSDVPDFDGADLVVVVGLDLSQKNRIFPALDFAIRRKVRLGSKLIIINGEDLALGSIADVNMIGDVVSLASGVLARDIEGESDEIKRAKELYESAENPVIICEPSYYDEIVKMSDKAKIMAMPYESNARGVAAVLQDMAEDGKINDVINSKTLYITGEVWQNIDINAEFVIMHQTYLNDQPQKADILLPAPISWELDGSIVDCFGNVVELQKALELPENIKTYRRLMSELSAKMSIDLEIEKFDFAKAMNSVKQSDFKGILPLKNRTAYRERLNDMIYRAVNSVEHDVQAKSEVG